MVIAGQQNLYFSLPAIVGWLGTALLHAALTVAMVLVGSDSLESDRHAGSAWSLQQSGLLMFTTVVITTHLQLGMVIDQWTWMHHVSIWGSVCELRCAWLEAELACHLLAVHTWTGPHAACLRRQGSQHAIVSSTID